MIEVELWPRTSETVRTDTAPPGTDADPHAILTDVRGRGKAHSFIIKDSTPLGPDGDPRMTALWQWMLHRFPSDGS